MNTWQTLLIVLGVIAMVFVVGRYVLPFLKKQGVDVVSLLDQTKDAIAVVDKTLDTLRPFLPSSPGLTTFDWILAAAKVGVGNAEQLYKVGKIEGDSRNAEARQYIMDTLQLLGIEVTPEMLKVIDGAIENQVLMLGHKEIPANS
jgi:hypothetical protein